MKSMLVFAMVMAVAACALQPGDEPEATGDTKAADPQQKGNAIIYTKHWDTTLTQAEQVAVLWPGKAENVQLLYRSGPTVYTPTTYGTEDAIATYLAFHVVDGAVDDVWMIPTDSATGTNFKAAVNVAINQHTNQPADLDHLGSTSGNGVKGIPPAPTPIIDSYDGFAISTTWQSAAVTAASQVTQASTTFSSYYENE